MEKQLLATFFVEWPDNLYEDVTVNAEIQYQDGTYWYQDDGLSATVEGAHYYEDEQAELDEQLRYRYKVNVFRECREWYDDRASQTFYGYSLYKAGIYKRRLSVTFNGASPLDRMMYLTIQPDVQVYRQADSERIDMVRTDATVLSQNPVDIQKTVVLESTTEALAARNIYLTKPNNYKGTVFVESNIPIDTYSDDLSIEDNGNSSEYFYNVWLRLNERIRMTRKYNGYECRWHDGYGNYPILNTDAQGQYATFISDNTSNSYESPLLRYDGAVELGLEKLLLDLPLFVESNLRLHGHGALRYTGIGEATEPTAPINLLLAIILKTVHAVKITPSPLVLDDDNNFTSFVTVEANEGAEWSFDDVDPRITVEPASGTGRTAVIVKREGLGGNSFENVPLTVASTVDAQEYPDIDGEYEVSDTAEVHIERYTPTRNALIPKMPPNTPLLTPNTSAPAFDHSLTSHGSVGNWATTLIVNDSTFENLESFPTVEVMLDNPHRIRSWTLQSVGAVGTARYATLLALSGRTLDGNWQVLDLARLPASGHTLYSDDKRRIDRMVQHRRVVNKIRISVLQVAGTTGTQVRLPQIQIFAGVPVLPIMTSASVDGVSVRSSGGNSAVTIFDGIVRGGNIASVGTAAWYVNLGNTPRNRVAKEGAICRVLQNDYQSIMWVALSFPVKRLLGYLYSIDDLSSLSGDHANTPYAASLYFEGRATKDDNAVQAGSVAGGWSEIGLISLDKCVGFNENPSSNTASLLANQGTLDTWAQNVLGLTGANRENAFLIDETDWNIIRFNASTGTWENDGTQFTTATDAIYNMDNRTHYADFASMLTMEQLRLSVRSVMNLARPRPDSPRVAMPEMQLFGLPAETINAGDVATVSYLKAEDANGNLHDILGMNQRLPWRQFYSYYPYTYFRIYLGEVINRATTGTHANLLYLNMTRLDGGQHTINGSINEDSDSWCDFTIYADCRTLAFYELYIYSSSGEKIILSSGYTGGTA